MKAVGHELRDYNRMGYEPLMSLYEHEIWLPIVGYEGLYDVSDMGNVRSYPRKGKNKGGILYPRIGAYGYPVLTLCKDGIKKSIAVHILVARHHIPNPNNYPQVNHIKGIKSDCRASQLEWCTALENVRHAFRTGLCVIVGGENHHATKYSDEVILNVYNEEGSHQSVADKYKISRRYVSQIKSGVIRKELIKNNNSNVL